MEQQKRVLSTKMLEFNQKQFLLNAGFAVLEGEFIKVQPTHFEWDTIHEVLIFTSQNAVNSILQHPEVEHLKEKKVICVGKKTKALLWQNGFDVIAATDYAVELAEIILSHLKDHSFTFFSGNLRRDILPDTMKNAGIVNNEYNVYETVLNPIAIKSPVDALLFFSPSAVQSYLSENTLTDQMCFCIGTTTAEALKDKTNNLVIATEQTVESTLVQCINYYKK
ncbi:MAG: uroporphyrinogen-III synthase [Flavobacterium sp.]|nr:uroporphyrinogen-III synthase [Candidatus Neoflavobacterium equi]